MPSDPPPRCSACPVRATAMCVGLKDDELAALHHIGRRRRIVGGQIICWAGEPSPICANLVCGVLKVTRAQADGRVQIVGLLYPGDFVGSLFVARAADTITALSDADLCVYPRPALEAVLADHPAARRLMLRRTMATLAEARRWMPMLARGRADARVAALLLDMARRSGCRDREAFCLPLSRGAMAEALGLAIETVSRHMTLFQDTGLIALSGLRGVRLLDPPRLAAVAG
ncbi:Crp/Fnr family transcriptional regulator [Sphingomonas sp. NPDC019816]|uniref:Crp/Fnr family transcriptional regulator n=1 Tax=Sphingomonas sp. NPDC019816 TaxID=3390679 RepID=UPI003D01223D